MMLQDNSCQVFFALLRAGLWEQEFRLWQSEGVDYSILIEIAEEQGVIGLIAAGLEHLQDVKAPKEMLLQLVGHTIQLEQQNNAMNDFIAVLVEKMKDSGIYTLLVKGQGIAQCYERPLWRSSGDVDFFMDEETFRRADEFLTPKATYRKIGGRYSKEIGLGVNSWTVELHASLRTGLSAKVDRVVDAVQKDTFMKNKVRAWHNGGTNVFLPAPDEDVFFVFTHFIKHFYKEGMNLRQLCDWCRLLWTYRESLNHGLLESRIRKAGLMTEWKGFAEVAVYYLGMPVEAMPLYNLNENHNPKRTEKIINLILRGCSGNKYRDTLRIGRIYPWSTLKFLLGILWHVNWLKIKERLCL